jgi:hypothetical protein
VKKERNEGGWKDNKKNGKKAVSLYQRRKIKTIRKPMWEQNVGISTRGVKRFCSERWRVDIDSCWNPQISAGGSVQTLCLRDEFCFISSKGALSARVQ